MRIAIDAMGGDKAPAAPVAGALEAVARFEDVEILLVGDPTALEQELAARGGKPARVHVVGLEIPLVDDENAGASLLEDEARNFSVLLGDAFFRIQQQHGDV